MYFETGLNSAGWCQALTRRKSSGLSSASRSHTRLPSWPWIGWEGRISSRWSSNEDNSKKGRCTRPLYTIPVTERYTEGGRVGRRKPTNQLEVSLRRRFSQRLYELPSPSRLDTSHSRSRHRAREMERVGPMANTTPTFPLPAAAHTSIPTNRVQTSNSGVQSRCSTKMWSPSPLRRRNISSVIRTEHSLSAVSQKDRGLALISLSGYENGRASVPFSFSGMLKLTLGP